MALHKRCFLTKDTRGCEFRAECFLETEKRLDYKSGKMKRVVLQSNYCGMGINAKTLKELKQKVGAL